MSWDLYKRINKFDYLILQNSNVSRALCPVRILFKRDELHLVPVAVYQNRWKNYKFDELHKYDKYDIWAQDDNLLYVILQSFNIEKPREFVNRFYLPDLFRKGFQLIDGKSKRWFENELYHEQFMDALEHLL